MRPANIWVIDFSKRKCYTPSPLFHKYTFTESIEQRAAFPCIWKGRVELIILYHGRESDAVTLWMARVRGEKRSLERRGEGWRAPRIPDLGRTACRAHSHPKGRGRSVLWSWKIDNRSQGPVVCHMPGAARGFTRVGSLPTADWSYTSQSAFRGKQGLRRGSVPLGAQRMGSITFPGTRETRFPPPTSHLCPQISPEAWSSEPLLSPALQKNCTQGHPRGFSPAGSPSRGTPSPVRKPPGTCSLLPPPPPQVTVRRPGSLVTSS